MNIPPATLTLLARAHYESGRFTGSTRPPYEATTEEWKSAMNRDMTAAIRAGVEAGVVEIKGLSDSRELAPGDQRAVGGEGRS